MAGYVYLIEAVGYGFYKIGQAEEITARFTGLAQAYHPIELRLLHVIQCQNCGMYPLEYRFHQWFKKQRVHWVDKKHRTEREWFVLSEEEVAWFEQIDDSNWDQMMPGVSHIVPHGV